MARARLRGDSCTRVHLSLVFDAHACTHTRMHTHTHTQRKSNTGARRYTHANTHMHTHTHTGLTKVPIDGQPPSIVQELEDMARQYIKGENAIVLVSAQSVCVRKRHGTTSRERTQLCW
jgi:hypothetical protein